MHFLLSIRDSRWRRLLIHERNSQHKWCPCDHLPSVHSLLQAIYPDEDICNPLQFSDTPLHFHVWHLYTYDIQVAKAMPDLDCCKEQISWCNFKLDYWSLLPCRHILHLLPLTLAVFLLQGLIEGKSDRPGGPCETSIPLTLVDAMHCFPEECENQ